MKERDIEIHVRSVFLQGLYFKKIKELSFQFKEAKLNIERIHKFSKETGLSIASICLNFALLNKYIDKAVIGVDNIENLKENLSLIKYKNIIQKNYSFLKNLKIENEDITIPLNWTN